MYKILHLIKSLGRGGAETLLSETLRVHDRKAFEFQYAYFVSYKGQLAEDLRAQDAVVTCLNADSAPAILASLPRLAAYVKRENFDLIHCHLPVSAVAGRLVGKFLGVPVVYTEHNKQERYHGATRRANLLTMDYNAAILAVSDDVRDSIAAHWKGPKGKLSVLINGVNTERYDPANYDRLVSRTELKLPATAPIVGTVCVFRDQKRLELWLDLARRLREAVPAVHFVLIGDGPTEELVKSRATVFDLHDCVHFPGRLDEVRPWLSAMDVYLMTSEFEGLPIAMLEAMSMALPIVATAAGGIPEAVTDGAQGFLRPVADWAELYDPLHQLVQDDTLRARLGASARKRVIADFSIQKMAGELEAVYHRILTSQPHPVA
ncbi:N-acetyl-alpha-D-glucosaminyl L-malate synthase [Neolewinella maritima]|uniref:N-acetyl-alpha-D-glucosaminyl L-malate synthase n=1 Tax=Neolewinella maritima TaxID=1383882 RepID=A0ABM9AXL4_9BACT|nr:glycosyltransferase [Neolewinella maritima]CAH0998971.1 N-acetyl-alpha-D-glucosaminyl L-malate synthase [Neolewinella maritima]